MASLIVLDPTEVATAGRVQLDLTPFAGPEIDWGDAAIEQYQADALAGRIPADYRVPNRTVVVPLVLKTVGATTFDTTRAAIQHKVALFQRDRGWIKRTSALGDVFADVVGATLHLGGGGFLEDVREADLEAVLTLECLPDFYGPEIDLGSVTETARPEVVRVLTGIKGNYPARIRITVEDDAAVQRHGAVWGMRSRNYDPARTAELVWSAADDLTPMDVAVPLANADASGSGAMINHASLSPLAWTPILSTDTLPAVRAVGAVVSGTGAVVVPLPNPTEPEDVLIMFLETENQAVTPPANWAHVSGSPVSNATGTVTRLSVLWRRAAAGETAPTVADPGDHVVARIVGCAGVITSGNPWDVTATATEAVSDTSVSIPGATTTVARCLVLAAVATGSDIASTTNIGTWTNADLKGQGSNVLIERCDNWVVDGLGGGFGVASGHKMTAGAYAATTATLVTAAEKAMMSIALKPQGDGLMTQKGTYRAWARVRSDSIVLPALRLVWDVGDLTSPSANPSATIARNLGFYNVDLGEVRLDPAPVGTHRWRGIIQGQGRSATTIADMAVDRLWLVPVDDGYGVLRSVNNGDPGLAPYVAHDDFSQTAGALGGKTATLGGNWATAGGDADDFQVVVSPGVARRTNASDTAPGRIATIGSSTVLQAAQVDFDAFEHAFDRAGLALRVTDINNFLFCGMASISGGSELQIARVLAGSATIMAQSGDLRAISSDASNFPLPWTFRAMVDAEGRVWLWWGLVGQPYRLLLQAQSSFLATGGSLQTGTRGIYDFGSAPVARTDDFDSFRAWTPTIDGLINASQDLEMRTDGMFRRDASGASYGPVGSVVGDLPRLPPAGLENRFCELFVRASQGDLGALPDGGIADDTTVRVRYQPSYLFVAD